MLGDRQIFIVCMMNDNIISEYEIDPAMFYKEKK